MTLRYIDAGALARLLPVTDAVDALERAFAAVDRPVTPLRTRLEARGGELLLMPAAGEQGVGVKLVTLQPSNPSRGLPLLHSVYLLFDPQTMAPEAALDGAALTALRTSAVSALATKHLALPGASRLVLFGAGVQAAAHLEAMRAVRPVSWVRVVSRSEGPALVLAERARSMGLDADVAGPEAVAEADLVCTCTTSATPVFDGALLRPGAHVNAVGAYRPDMRELDDQAILRARVVVETREAALEEAGDLLQPIASGVIGEDHIVTDLGDVVRGAPVRTSAQDVTVFKSVGVAFEDLAVARQAVGRI